MLAQIYILTIFITFVIIWLKHFYLVHFRLNSYMKMHFNDEWSKMKEDPGWYRPSWATLYYGKGVYEFIWGKDRPFNDENIEFIVRKIKRIIWELPAFIVIVMGMTILLISLGILK